MNEITTEKLEGVIAGHRHWIAWDCYGWEGMRAVLSYTDLRGANLSGAILQEAILHGAALGKANLFDANLRGADLAETNLRDANLHRADLRGADLKGADLQGADLHKAKLSCADLQGADLQGADLRGAKLGGAVLTGANLDGCTLPEGEEYRKGVVLMSPMLGYKKAREGVILTAEIPTWATVFCINGGKCRTDKAVIKDTGGMTLHSVHDGSFAYSEGMQVDITDFDRRYNVECAVGIHFFRTREEAEDYDYT